MRRRAGRIVNRASLLVAATAGSAATLLAQRLFGRGAGNADASANANANASANANAAPATAPPEPTRVGSPLDAVNDDFHAAYDGARDEAEADAPVFIVLADSLVVFRRGERREHVFTPRFFHVVKSVAHAPVALYAFLHRGGDHAFDDATATRLAALRSHLSASLASLGADENAEDERDAVEDSRAVLEATLDFVSRTLADRRTTIAGLDDFARSTGPSLLRLIHHATRIQLEALDDCVAAKVALLDPAERGALQVVVAGDHQARIRSLGMQYFQARLGEPKGAEERVTYAEGVSDEREALALVGKRRLDAAIARAFFGDAKRLQRDVLGDAVHDLLAELELPPIV